MNRYASILLLLAGSLSLLPSCQSELADTAAAHREIARQVPSPLSFDYDESHFPATDKSRLLSTTNTPLALKQILTAIDPKRALDISVFTAPHLGDRRLTETQLAEMKKKADAVTAKCKTEVEKLRALHKYIVENTTYDNNGNGSNDPYGAYTGGVCVCQGYANMLKVFLYTQGIPCVGVNGNLFQGEMYLGAHAWNYVYADGKWLVDYPTNDGSWPMDKLDGHKHLRPLRTDIELFEDERFAYDFYEGRLNVGRVKKADDILTVPFSVNGLRVSAFNPHEAIPTNVKQIYIGANIESLGDEMPGLRMRPGREEAVFVSKNNKKFIGRDGIVYSRNWRGKIEALVYIPAAMKNVKLQPAERIEKNQITDNKSIEQLVILPGTKLLESYAVENCPNLKRVYLPADCELQKDAFYRCGSDIQIFRGDFTGMARVRR